MFVSNWTTFLELHYAIISRSTNQNKELSVEGHSILDTYFDYLVAAKSLSCPSRNSPDLYLSLFSTVVNISLLLSPTPTIVPLFIEFKSEKYLEDDQSCCLIIPFKNKSNKSRRRRTFSLKLPMKISLGEAVTLRQQGL